MRPTLCRILTLCGINFLVAPPIPAQTAPAAATTAPAAIQPHDFSKWEKEIAAYEQKDRENPPTRGGIVFIGSSTIRGWKTLEHDFPKHAIINRGFGGSQIVDSTHFAPRVIFPYAPKQVFLRAGGNDIHEGKSADQVFADFQTFARTVRERLPEAEVVFISLSPAPARWAERDANRALNEKVKAYCEATRGMKFVDTYDMTLTSDGKPREELFVADKLHFNAHGYKLLAERVRPLLR